MNYDVITFTGCSLPTPPPTLSKAFSVSPTIVGSGVSRLTFTIRNVQPGNRALTNVSFADALPTGLEVVTPAATPANYGTTGAGCTGVTFAPTAGATTLNYAATNVAAGATCTAYVDVKATKAGQFDNVSGYITSAESGENKSANGYGTATLVAIGPPVLAKSFSPTSIVTGSTSTMSFTITNPNLSNSLSGIGFTDSGAGWPAGLTVATSGPTSTCGGTLSTTSPNSLTFSGGRWPQTPVVLSASRSQVQLPEQRRIPLLLLPPLKADPAIQPPLPWW